MWYTIFSKFSPLVKKKMKVFKKNIVIVLLYDVVKKIDYNLSNLMEFISKWKYHLFGKNTFKVTLWSKSTNLLSPSQPLYPFFKLGTMRSSRPSPSRVSLFGTPSRSHPLSP